MKRNKELDALRGLAAVSVLLYHALATNSANLTAGISLGNVEGTVNFLLVYTPLHLIWMGAEAVWLFFILSGFVLTRSANRDSFTWEAYFPSRIVRLYVPVLVAVALAWSVYSLARLAPGFGTDQALIYKPESMLQDITLVGGTTPQMGVLWSLQWEVIFSLSLPLFLFLVRRHKKVAACLAVLGCCAGVYFNIPVASFLPMFFIGVLLAQQWGWIASRFRFLEAKTFAANSWGILLTIVAICAITSFFLIGRLLIPSGLPVRVVTTLISLSGICLLIIVSLIWPPLRSLLTTRPLVFLGAMSFSLYLVHLPIVIVLAHLLPTGLPNAALAVVTSMLVGVLFYFLVEKRAHALSRKIASRLHYVNRETITNADPAL